MPVVIPSGNRGKHFRHSMADTWEELGGAKGEETAIRIYYIRKNLFSIKGKKEVNNYDRNIYLKAIFIDAKIMKYMP